MNVSRRGFFGGLATALLAGFGLAPAARRPPPPLPPPLPGTTPEQAFLNEILAFRAGKGTTWKDTTSDLGKITMHPPGWWLETPKGG